MSTPEGELKKRIEKLLPEWEHFGWLESTGKEVVAKNTRRDEIFAVLDAVKAEFGKLKARYVKYDDVVYIAFHADNFNETFKKWFGEVPSEVSLLP
jgi:hypothetical protein